MRYPGDNRTKEEIKANITRAARTARTASTHPSAAVRDLAPGLHEIINLELDRLEED